MANSILTPLQLTVAASLLQNQGFKSLPSTLTTAINAFDATDVIADVAFVPTLVIVSTTVAVVFTFVAAAVAAAAVFSFIAAAVVVAVVADTTGEGKSEGDFKRVL